MECDLTLNFSINTQHSLFCLDIPVNLNLPNYILQNIYEIICVAIQDNNFSRLNTAQSLIGKRIYTIKSEEYEGMIQKLNGIINLKVVPFDFQELEKVKRLFRNLSSS